MKRQIVFDKRRTIRILAEPLVIVAVCEIAWKIFSDNNISVDDIITFNFVRCFYALFCLIQFTAIYPIEWLELCEDKIVFHRVGTGGKVYICGTPQVQVKITYAREKLSECGLGFMRYRIVIFDCDNNTVDDCTEDRKAFSLEIPGRSIYAHALKEYYNCKIENEEILSYRARITPVLVRGESEV